MKTGKVIVPILVIIIAVVLTFVLVKSRKVPEPHEAPYLGPLVEVAELEQGSHKVVVGATGTVQARYEVDITPQVRGRVSELSPNMVAGGRFRKGELLLAIEDVDYRLAIDLAKANLAQAELELLRNENLARVARQEWQAINSDGAAEPDPLVVYEPQMKSARAQRDAALANVRQAEVNLERTRIFAPFDGYVREENVEKDQYLTAGSPVATIVSSGQAEIIVPLPLDELAWLQVPLDGADGDGSKAEIRLQSGGRLFRWQGRISRALGEIDPRNRMARVVVTVAGAGTVTATEDGPLSRLMPGMFVEVYLHGKELNGVLAVPRGALHDNDTLWVVDDANRLRIRSVEIDRRERDEVLVRSGVTAGERIVLTNLSGAAEGMLLRPVAPEASP